ncbi:MAG: glycosidase, partial [Calditrichaeota bacterium]
MMKVIAQRFPAIVIRPDPRRVLFRPFSPRTQEQALRIIARIMALSEEEVEEQLSNVMEEFGGRHQRLEDFLLRRFEAIKHYLMTDKPLTNSRKL